MSHKWYAIQTYAGSEMAVKRAIENLVVDHGIPEKLAQILVPTEDVIEIKNGKQKIKERSLYSGYVFANLCHLRVGCCKTIICHFFSYFIKTPRAKYPRGTNIQQIKNPNLHPPYHLQHRLVGVRRSFPLPLH